MTDNQPSLGTEHSLASPEVAAFIVKHARAAQAADVKTEDLPLTYVELREEITSAAFTANVDPNNDNGLVEVWIDPATLNVSAVANIRLTPDEARAMGAALIGAANALDASAPAWVHAMDGTPCESGPLVEDETFCADHDRRITKKEN